MSDSYLLPREPTESERLNMQHRYWTANYGYIIHPEIEARLPSDARIADVGTGTAIWAVDLASQKPSSYQIDAFDISADQYPPEETLPSNVRLHIANAKEPFPSEFIGKYDLVHLRLLVCAMEKHEWEPAVKNILTLLKPGGAIQWEEISGANCETLRGSTKPSSIANMTRIRKMFVQGCGHRLRHGWNMLGDIFLKLGMTDVDVDPVTSDRVPETRRAVTLSSVSVCLGFIRFMMKTGGLVSITPAELDEVEKEAHKEIDAGGYIRSMMWVHYGFKNCSV